MEKQTVQSGRGLEGMKGISKAPVVLGTYRRQLLINGRVNQPFHTAPGERLLPQQWPKEAHREDFLVSVYSRCFASLCSFPHEVMGQRARIQGSINLGCKGRLRLSKAYNHLEQKHPGGSFKSSKPRLPVFSPNGMHILS